MDFFFVATVLVESALCSPIVIRYMRSLNKSGNVKEIYSANNTGNILEERFQSHPCRHRQSEHAENVSQSCTASIS